nr:beta-ketoacyl synthase N-terminal-like domain-containing protein [Kitasatospora acidiphila]
MYDQDSDYAADGSRTHSRESPDRWADRRRERLGRADVVVAGGVEASIQPLPLAAFAQMMALSTANDDPEHSSRPFDAKRDGFVLGEGGAILVLERADQARARGARAHGAVLGAGITSSAAHISASDVPGQIRAMRQSLRDAGLDGTDIGLVHAHATSTPQGDLGRPTPSPPPSAGTRWSPRRSR